MPISADGITKLHRAASTTRGTQALFKYLSNYEKDRLSVSARGLFNGARKAGVSVTMADCRAVVDAISEAGLGKITKDGQGNPSIKYLEVSAREIGEVVHGNSKNLRTYGQERKARAIDAAAEAVMSSASELKVYPMRQASSISITLTINGKPVILPLPPDLNPDQLSALIERLKRVEDGYDPKRNK